MAAFAEQMGCTKEARELLQEAEELHQDGCANFRCLELRALGMEDVNMLIFFLYQIGLLNC